MKNVKDNITPSHQIHSMITWYFIKIRHSNVRDIITPSNSVFTLNSAT